MSKGSRNRTRDKRKFDDNFDEIRWPIRKGKWRGWRADGVFVDEADDGYTMESLSKMGVFDALDESAEVPDLITDDPALLDEIKHWDEE